MTKTTQLMIAVSATTKTFISDEAESHGGPSKTKDFLNASQKEIADAMVNFVESKRYETRSEPVMIEGFDDEGEAIEVQDTAEDGSPLFEEVEIDTFAEEVQKVIAKRETATRRNTQAATIATQAEELEKLKAQLAALQGE